MSVRIKLFGAMAILVFFMAVAYLMSTQGYMRSHMPALVAAAEQMRSNPNDQQLVQIEQNIYINMFHIAFKVIGGLTIIALVLGFWLSRMLTAPLHQLTTAIDRIGKGDLSKAILVTTRDEYGQVAEALNQMAANLAHSEEVRKHLVADVAHELRTPLTIIQGQLEFIQQNGKTIAPETLLPMQDELIRLSALVNDLHHLSLAEAGKLPLEKKKTNVYDLLVRLKELLRTEVDEKGVQVSLSSSVEDSVLSIDAHRITQVFYNLIWNAIRYTPPSGQISIHLTERIEPNNKDFLLISIMDTGTGIPTEHLPYLFDRFYRAQGDRSRQSGGMGLGLAIAKQFVEAHGGEIEVNSKVGAGTTFNVYLPRIR
jgi:two-component system sensor histidine kinase BaeS